MLGDVEVVGQQADAEAGGTSCHTYSFVAGREVAISFLPGWLQDYNAVLDFRCRGDLYASTGDGLPRRLTAHIEGTERSTGLTRLAIDLEVLYSCFDDPGLTLPELPLPDK
jgi:hypothetical protein